MSAWCWPPPAPPPAASNPTTSELWAPPSSPSAFDDEFAAETLGADWKLFGYTDASFALKPIAPDFTTPIDLFTNAADRTVRTSLTRRRSWLQMQPGQYSGGGTEDFYMVKPIALPSNCAIVTRMANFGITAPTNASWGFRVGLALLSDTGGGAPNKDSHIRVEIRAEGTQLRAYLFNDGTGAWQTSLPTASGYLPPIPVAMLGIQKIGNSYYGFYGDDSGTLTSFTVATPATHAANLVWGGFYLQGNVGTDRTLNAFDYIRMYEGVRLPL